MSRKPGEPKTGGRQKGTRNKLTVARAEQAERQLTEAKTAGRKLSIDRLEWLADTFEEAVQYFKPRDWADLDESKERQFVKYAGLLKGILIALAPYQSPQLKSVFVSQQVAESVRDESVATRLVAFFDSLAAARMAERSQRSKAKRPAEPPLIEGTLVESRIARDSNGKRA